jgi:hypothetical protein
MKNISLEVFRCVEAFVVSFDFDTKNKYKSTSNVGLDVPIHNHIVPIIASDDQLFNNLWFSVYGF